MIFGIIALLLVGLSWLLWGIVMGRAPKDGIVFSGFFRLSS